MNPDILISLAAAIFMLASTTWAYLEAQRPGHERSRVLHLIDAGFDAMVRGVHRGLATIGAARHNH